MYYREDVFRGGPGLRAYVYRAEIYCPACAQALDFGAGPWDWIDFTDSDTVPQPAFFPESDSPQYCAACERFLYGPTF